MKVLVTGATGFVGREVLRQLHEAGHQARVLVRNHSNAAKALPQPTCVTEFHQGDVTVPGTLTSAAKGCEAIIHLVGIISEYRSVTFQRLHVEATRNMVDVAKEAGVKRFVQMSALGTRPNAPARYHQTKWAAEEIVRASVLDYTILQPSVIYGPEDHFVNLFAQMAGLMPFLPVIGSGKNLLQPVSVELVARCFVRSLDIPESIGRAFQVCGPDRLQAVELARVILKVTGKNRRLLRIAIPLAWLMAASSECIMAGLLGKQPPLTRDQLLMLQEDNVGDPSEAENLFKLRQVDFEAGIEAYLA